MAANTSESASTETQAKEDHKQTNGQISQKDELKIISFSPRPQRVLRLNRRGFFLSSQEQQGSKSSEQKTLSRKIKYNSQSKDSSSNNCSASKESEFTSPSSEKRIIKLNCSKKNSGATLEKSQKRNSSDNSNSQEVPPKKKHKLITWP